MNEGENHNGEQERKADRATSYFQRQHTTRLAYSDYNKTHPAISGVVKQTD